MEMQKFPLDVMKYTRMSRDNLSVSYQNTDFLPCKSAVQGCKMGVKVIAPDAKDCMAVQWFKERR